MNKNRFRIVMVVISIFFSLLLFRMYYIQIWQFDNLKKIADKQYIRIKNVSSLRGNIIDCKGRVLVFSSFRDSCYADPARISNREKVAHQLASCLGMNEQEIVSKLSQTNKHFVWLGRRIDIQQVEKIKHYAIPGIGFVREEKRMYPYGDLAGHLLGKIGAENQPLSGIEFAAHSILSGSVSTKKITRDALGKEILEHTSAQIDRACDVVLTIDRTIQYIAETELEKAMKTFHAQQGVVIVQEPATGDILAMAVSPTLLMEESSDVGGLLNRAISGVWEPGSTFKAFTMAAALEQGVVSPNDVFDCENGSYAVRDCIINDHLKYGKLTVHQIMEQSSNIGMVKICSALSKEKLYCYIRSFGFGAFTGIQLSGETKGILRSPKYWSGVTSSMLSFGQEIGITPIQLLAAYSAIANGGYLMQPKIIKEVIDREGKVMWSSDATRTRKVLKEETTSRLKDMLKAVVKRGTGVNAQVKGFSVCGKTGTGQQIDNNTNTYSKNRYLASFCGFLPAANPRVCILVFIDNPQGVYWGGYVAAPVFSRIASRVMTYLHCPPDAIDDNSSERVIKQYVNAVNR